MYEDVIQNVLKPGTTEQQMTATLGPPFRDKEIGQPGGAKEATYILGVWGNQSVGYLLKVGHTPDKGVEGAYVTEIALR